MPVLNLTSYDNEIFFLGSFYTNTPAADSIKDAEIRGAEMRQLFEAYWNNLWNSAIPLNDRGRINWDELKTIGHKVGMAEDEFNLVVSK